jgi:NAD(P)-dependent dehydrogenase (short-subunit alcohol dehydrogenase family)
VAGRLRDKRCLIIGGTGGIGLAAARRFAEEHASLVVTGLTTEEAAAAQATLASLGRVFTLACDATDPHEVEQLLARTLEVLGPLHECSDDGWRHTLDLNLTGTFLTNRAAVRHFLASKQPGVILNMASVLALAPSPHHFETCAYAASKGGVVALSRLAAARYAADGIRVNVLAPGLIDTPMAARACGDEAILHFLRSKQPLAGGPGAPADCADAAVFLCSDEARLITGAVLPVDGGWCVSEGQYWA